MPIKLQVVKEDDDGDPADYLFEQDRITIGRGSGNDLTLPDQKVSTEHAEIRSDGGDYLLYDRDSKNKTYVDGQRVGEQEPYTLKSGDVFQVGDFRVEFAPLFMPSSEQTAFAEDSGEGNPFEKHAQQLAAALEGLAETYKFAPADQRDESFAEAVREHLDPEMAQATAVKRVLDRLGNGAPDADHSASASAGDEPPTTVLDALLQGVSRMISIPNHFWREFTGKTLEHPPEKEVLYGADLDALRDHLLDGSISEDERTQRLQHLSDAVESLVTHNMAMLVGYKKAVMTGSKDLLQEVDPSDAVEEAKQEGGGIGGFFGGGQRSELERLHDAWKELHRGDWGELESELFRPTYVEAYVDRMAEAWDLERAEIMPDEDRA
jgi:pSer/pThr/pTyr-binding forkhead associated (FHA) protein